MSEDGADSKVLLQVYLGQRDRTNEASSTTRTVWGYAQFVLDRLFL